VPARLHKLDLYRLAVQHPEAECAFLLRAHAHCNRGARRRATTLREDFAGTAAVAATWVALHEDHRALAIERHGPTLRWAQRRAARELAGRADDLHFVHGDVLTVGPPDVPCVDVIAALNFSALVYHTRDDMLAYLRHARRCLRPGGLLVMDLFGPGETLRRQVTVQPEPGEVVGAFRYCWEQRSYDPATERIDCRIHFSTGRCADKRLWNNAFCYDWRLWRPDELSALLTEAGYRRVQLWAPYNPRDRRFRPLARTDVARLTRRKEWIAYVVGQR